MWAVWQRENARAGLAEPQASLRQAPRASPNPLLSGAWAWRVGARGPWNSAEAVPSRLCWPPKDLKHQGRREMEMNRRRRRTVKLAWLVVPAPSSSSRMPLEKLGSEEAVSSKANNAPAPHSLVRRREAARGGGAGTWPAYSLRRPAPTCAGWGQRSWRCSDLCWLVRVAAIIRMIISPLPPAAPFAYRPRRQG